MPFITIPPGDVDQGSVVDESLMSGKIKNDLDDLNSRVVALEALSGGGVAASDAENIFAKIIAGGETNEAKFWKFRHYPGASNIPGHKDQSGADLEMTEWRERWMHDSKFTLNSGFTGTDALQYFSRSYLIAQNEQLQFRIKKGENFFCIGTLFGSSSASVVRVYVDGVNANTYGLKDETGAAVPATLNQNNATVYYGKVYHYYGLDGEEHIITIKNENGSAQGFWFNFADIGYRSPDYAIDHKIKLNSGVAEVGNIAASFDEGEFTFTEPTEGLANGYTGMLKISEAGTVTKVDGPSPARTEIKPKSAIAFSGAVTTLPVKNHYAFPTNGICLFQMPDGAKYFFSYNAKGDPGGPQNQSLDSIVWQKQPNEDFTFLPDKAGATYATNEIRGDGRIEYWAKAPILIDGTNNKIDFEITVNGVTTQHTATIPSGRYSADIVPLESAIRTAMSSVKPINGQYFAKWNELSQLWTVGVNDPEVSQIDFEWATGANSASSLGPTLGFTSDSTGNKTYIALAEKQHKAARVFVADTAVRSAYHPSVKYNWNDLATHDSPDAQQIIEKYPALTQYRRWSPGNFTGNPALEIYPDDDCCGITLYFMRSGAGVYNSIFIDNVDKVSLGQQDRPTDTSNPEIGSLQTAFVSFPKGTHRITLWSEDATYYIMEGTSIAFTFFGYRQHYTKPAWEELTAQEKVLKTFEIAPKRLFSTYYGHNTALYTPQPTNDNINSITESGTWTQSGVSDVFNGRFRSTATLNGYVEVEFVLQGDGGGIGLLSVYSTADSLDATMYLSNVAINETTDMVERDIQYSDGVLYDCAPLWHIGLKAGTYKARFKTQHASRLLNSAIIVIDAVPPQQNAPTLTDIANVGQSVAYPLHVRRRAGERYGSHLVPEGLSEQAYKRGVVTHFDYRSNTDVEYQSGLDIMVSMPMYWASYRNLGTSEYMQYTTFCRSLMPMGLMSTLYSTVVQPAVDGRNLNIVNWTQNVKNGFSVTGARNSVMPAVFFDFRYPCTFNASLTYNIADTRGMRTGKAILVDNTGAKEEVYISSFVTDTSFTISKALTVLTPANVVTVLFWGMHNLRVTAGNATQWYLNGYSYEPLPIEESILQTRISTDTFEEVVELEQALGSTAGTTIQYFNIPLHSDGERGDPKSTEVIGLVNTPNTTEKLTMRIGAYVPTAGTNGKTINVRSRRKIPKTFDFKVRG